MKFRRIILLSVISFLSLSAFAANGVNDSVTKVLVVFKTHLDVGFTDLSSVVENRYMTEFIPKALDVSEKLNADGSGDRYVWTTGSWLVWNYLKSASPAEVVRLEDAIRRGDIVWNAVPYTVETESMNADLLETNLHVAKLLDKKYGKKTIAAKMTDVPGHTRSIVEPLARNGIKFLHVGVNPASALPAVPPFCRWRDPDGNEIILTYQQDYGTENLLPDGKTSISVNFLTSSTCHPKFFREERCDALMAFHEHCFADCLLVLRQCNLYCHDSLGQSQHFVHAHIDM